MAAHPPLDVFPDFFDGQAEHYSDIAGRDELAQQYIQFRLDYYTAMTQIFDWQDPNNRHPDMTAVGPTAPRVQKQVAGLTISLDEGLTQLHEEVELLANFVVRDDFTFFPALMLPWIKNFNCREAIEAFSRGANDKYRL